MITKYGFTQFTIQEFENYIKNLSVLRTVSYIQQHHTFSPDYKLFNGSNQLEIQNGMRNHHVKVNGWSDIGQHFSIFPDGTIVSGRSLENIPACIYGFNSNSICIENVGNFDIGKDHMANAQKETIVKMTAILCNRFNIPVNTDKIVYHHWFNLSTGERNNGKGGNKSCPGTAFFGGNSVEACQNNFLPLVQNALNILKQPKPAPILEYRIVTTNSLNVRVDASSKAAIAQEPVTLGSILRIYAEKDGWYKISNSSEKWVSGKYTEKVIKAIVNAKKLNVRSGPGLEYRIIGSLADKTEIFIKDEKNVSWSQIAFEIKWVNNNYLKMNV